LSCGYFDNFYILFMSTFSKKLQKFLIYFFTGVSAVVIVLGIDRAKETSALGITPVSDNDSNSSPENTEQKIVKNSNILGTTIALLDTTVTAQGVAYQTPWGKLTTNVQVKNGKMVAVEIPELPGSPPSIYAEPYLIDQALNAGGTNIQGVSGATITTNAFKSSLESALASARKQGGTSSTTSTKTVPTIKTATQSKTVTQKSTTPPAYVPLPVTTQPVVQPTLIQTAPKTGVSGTFTGDPFSTKWGNAVASITVTNGKITGVTMPQVPNSPPSIDAEPFLVSQALVQGNANIQGVSGATVVSNAFRASLENAIAKANAQAVTQGAGAVATSPTTTITSSANSSISNTQTTTYRKSKRYHDDDEEDDD
jgi:uncharacterized protein with FMN-binding domain